MSHVLLIAKLILVLEHSRQEKEKSSKKKEDAVDGEGAESRPRKGSQSESKDAAKEEKEKEREKKSRSKEAKEAKEDAPVKRQDSASKPDESAPKHVFIGPSCKPALSDRFLLSGLICPRLRSFRYAYILLVPVGSH